MQIFFSDKFHNSSVEYSVSQAFSIIVENFHTCVPNFSNERVILAIKQQFNIPHISELGLPKKAIALNFHPKKQI